MACPAPPETQHETRHGRLRLAPGWQGSFVFLAVLASLVLGYVCLRFDETHHARDPRVIHPLRLASNYRALLGDRHYLGFGLALAYGSLFAFISSSGTGGCRRGTTACSSSWWWPTCVPAWTSAD
jgi:hypothetical protein